MTPLCELRLPYPPSANTHWRSYQGRVIVSKKGREYRRKVYEAVLAQLGVYYKTLPITRMRCEIVMHQPDFRERDVDNIVKTLLDAVAGARVIINDATIDELQVVRGGAKKGGEVQLRFYDLGGNSWYRRFAEIPQEKINAVLA